MSLEIHTCKTELKGKHKETEDHGSLILEQVLMPKDKIQKKKGLFLNNKTLLLLNSGGLMMIL